MDGVGGAEELSMVIDAIAPVGAGLEPAVRTGRCLAPGSANSSQPLSTSAFILAHHTRRQAVGSADSPT